MRNAGIFVAGSEASKASNVTIKNNYIVKTGATAIRYYETKDSSIIGNTVLDSNGGHANGITAYLNCSNILIEGNTVINSNVALTFQEIDGINVINNLFVGSRSETSGTRSFDYSALAIWTYTARNVKILNNTLLSDYQNTLQIGGADNIEIRNNVISGFGDFPSTGAIISNNLHTKFCWNQKTYPGDIFNPDRSAMNLANIFVNPSANDYHLKSGSIAIDAGVNLPGLVDVDIEGRSRPQGSAWDIGAYEFTDSAN